MQLMTSCNEKVKAPPVEKLATSAFSLKPQAPRVPANRGSKRRSNENFTFLG